MMIKQQFTVWCDGPECVELTSVTDSVETAELEARTLGWQRMIPDQPEMPGTVLHYCPKCKDPSLSDWETDND